MPHGRGECCCHPSLIGSQKAGVRDDDRLVGADGEHLFHGLFDPAVSLGDRQGHHGDLAAAFFDRDGSLEGVLVKVADLVRDRLQNRCAVSHADHLDVEVRLHADDYLHAQSPFLK